MLLLLLLLLLLLVRRSADTSMCAEDEQQQASHDADEQGRIAGGKAQGLHGWYEWCRCLTAKGVQGFEHQIGERITPSGPAWYKERRC